MILIIQKVKWSHKSCYAVYLATASVSRRRRFNDTLGATISSLKASHSCCAVVFFVERHEVLPQRLNIPHDWGYCVLPSGSIIQDGYQILNPPFFASVQNKVQRPGCPIFLILGFSSHLVVSTYNSHSHRPYSPKYLYTRSSAFWPSSCWVVVVIFHPIIFSSRVSAVWVKVTSWCRGGQSINQTIAQ